MGSTSCYITPPLSQLCCTRAWTNKYISDSRVQSLNIFVHLYVCAARYTIRYIFMHLYIWNVSSSSMPYREQHMHSSKWEQSTTCVFVRVSSSELRWRRWRSRRHKRHAILDLFKLKFSMRNQILCIHSPAQHMYNILFICDYIYIPFIMYNICVYIFVHMESAWHNLAMCFFFFVSPILVGSVEL